MIQNFVSISPDIEFGNGDGDSEILRILPLDEDQLFRVGIRQGLEQQCIQQCEHGCVRANSQCENCVAMIVKDGVFRRRAATDSTTFTTFFFASVCEVNPGASAKACAAKTVPAQVRKSFAVKSSPLISRR